MTLYVETAGEGLPVVLLHAGLCDSRMWDRQWTVFSAGYRTVRCDLRGFGRSPLPPEPYSNARDVIALLDQLGLDRVLLVGASLGGRTALEIAVAQPVRVAGLLLAAPGLLGHAWSGAVRSLWSQEEAALQRGDLDAAVEVNLRGWVDGPGRDPSAVDRAVRDKVAEMQRLAFELQLPVGEDADKQLLVPDVADRLGEIAAPTLVLIGDHDIADLLAIADRVVGAVRGARRTVLAGTAHLPNMEQPAEFNRLALEFFGRAAAP